MDILMMLILPVHEHSICFHLFVSSLISFFNVVQFSDQRSFTSLVMFIPRYFIFLVALVNGIPPQFLNMILFIYFQRERMGERKGGRETSMCGCLSHGLPLGTWTENQACALTGNLTGNPLVCRPALNPLSYTSRAFL